MRAVMRARAARSFSPANHAAKTSVWRISITVDCLLQKTDCQMKNGFAALCLNALRHPSRKRPAAVLVSLAGAARTGLVPRDLRMRLRSSFRRLSKRRKIPSCHFGIGVNAAERLLPDGQRALIDRIILFRADGRPLPPCMNEGKYPNHLAFDFIHEAVIFVRDQLARAWYLSWASHLGKVGEPSSRGAEKRIHPRRRVRVVSSDGVPNAGAILLGFRRPNDSHASLATPARRAANKASTSSSGRPRPARIEVRATSTFCRRNAS